ncbi:MAG TPA: hypothetical protein VGS12_13485 [Caulobacteraceae bacterium]|nr:hypothetical protein [Caulobacteraceae bacterium]
MVTVRLPYVRRKRGLLFWEPTRAMRARGFLPKPLGPEGDVSIAEARRLYGAWKQLLSEGEKVSAWPAGSLGHFYDAMRRTAAWQKKALRTRQDYERAWRHLGELAPRTLTRISVDDVERLADALEARAGAHERYRTVKCLRAMLADASFRLQLAGWANPAKGIRNPQPVGRSAIWLGAEVAQLIAAARAMGPPREGMALAIAVAWETLFAPIDVWTLTRAELKRDVGGAFLEHARTKTGKLAYGALTAATDIAILLYLRSLPFAVPPEGALLRRHTGAAWISKDTFGDDFREVRLAAFGSGERRQFQDLRRSGNVEADAAGADKATMAQLLANTLDRSAFLDETYTPPTVAKARQVANLRLEGRKRLAVELTRARSK